MNKHDETFQRIREELKAQREAGHPILIVKLHPELRKIFEANHGVEHRGGHMWLDGARLIADPGVTFGSWSGEYGGPYSDAD